MGIFGKIGKALGGIARKALPMALDFIPGGGTIRKIGGALGGAFKNDKGGIDPTKIIGAGGALANLIGQGRQRKSAQRYANSQIDQRNQLLQRILTPPDLGITPRDPLQQSQIGF